jgi:hypothetical protein
MTHHNVRKTPAVFKFRHRKSKPQVLTVTTASGEVVTVAPSARQVVVVTAPDGSRFVVR